MRRSLVCLTLLLAALVVAGCHGGPDKAGGKASPKATVLTMAVPFGEPTELNGFANEVRRLSHGAMRIALTPRWRYGQIAYEKGLIADVQAGKAELGVAGTRSWDSVGVTSLRALGAPLLIDSYALQDRVLESPMIRDMLRGLKPLGLVGLGILPGQLRRPLGVSRALRGPSDYAGETIGVQQSRVASATIRALGGTPVWFGGGASIAKVDGIEYDVSDILGSGYDRDGKYLTANVVLWPRPIVLFARRSAFAGLTRAQRHILQQAVSNDVTAETKAMVSSERRDTEALCVRRQLRILTAAPADIAALRRAVHPVYAQLARDPQTRGFVSAIRTLRARIAAPPSTLPNCSAGATVSTFAPTTPVDGAYAVVVEPHFLPESQRIPEAYGSWQIVLDRGRFRFTQRSDGADWVSWGQVRIAGSEMRWTVAGSADVGPHGVPDGIPLKSNDVLDFRWERRGSTLRLESKGSRPSLPALVVRPLARVADAPGQQPRQNPRALQGTWAGKANAADVTAHHDDPSGVADNTGPLRFTLHGSRCRWTQRAPDAFNWGVGTCRFAGDTIELDMTRTGDGNLSPAPMFLHWSVFHDRLTFRRAPGFSPEAWAYHPWRKIR